MFEEGPGLCPPMATKLSKRYGKGISIPKIRKLTGLSIKLKYNYILRLSHPYSPPTSTLCISSEPGIDWHPLEKKINSAVRTLNTMYRNIFWVFLQFLKILTK